MEEADTKVEQSRDALATEMYNILSRENEFAEYILQFLKCQRIYHENCLKSLQTLIPQLEKKIGMCLFIYTPIIDIMIASNVKSTTRKKISHL